MRTQLVVGASGMVGGHIVKSLNKRGYTTVGTFCNTPTPSTFHLKISNADEVSTFFEKLMPQTVYLAAALTNVDYCETHPDEAYQVNVSGVKNVVMSANRTNAKLIYFSTDYIFNGENGPYDEEATADPINVYGRQKLEAEHYISLFANDYLIIRTTVVYGWEHQGKNFICQLVKSLSNGMPVKTPTDQIGSPTYAPNLSEIAVHLSETPIKGIINIAGTDLISRYEFAKKAALIFGLDDNLVIPVQTKELNQQANRPRKAGLLTNKLTAVSKIPVTSHGDGLRKMAKDQPKL